MKNLHFFELRIGVFVATLIAKTNCVAVGDTLQHRQKGYKKTTKIAISWPESFRAEKYPLPQCFVVFIAMLRTGRLSVILMILPRRPECVGAAKIETQRERT